jgi:hypothetical protein
MRMKHKVSHLSFRRGTRRPWPRRCRGNLRGQILNCASLSAMARIGRRARTDAEQCWRSITLALIPRLLR